LLTVPTAIILAVPTVLTLTVLNGGNANGANG